MGTPGKIGRQKRQGIGCARPLAAAIRLRRLSACLGGWAWADRFYLVRVNMGCNTRRESELATEGA